MFCRPYAGPDSIRPKKDWNAAKGLQRPRVLVDLGLVHLPKMDFPDTPETFNLRPSCRGQLHSSSTWNYSESGWKSALCEILY